MASIYKRKSGSYSVVYYYTDDEGKRHQKWVTFPTRAEAKKKLIEIESQQEAGTFQVSDCNTLDDLLKEYVETYGVNNWALSTYESRKSLIANYVSPIIGNMKLSDITPRVMDQYYRNLLKMKSVSNKYNKARSEYVSPNRVREIHKILRSAFEHAVRWEMISRNPVAHATLPKLARKERAIWTADNLAHALEICDDDMLSLAINLAFACSLRMGEMLGLTWDCVEISGESIRNGEAYIYVNKELQRASRDAMDKMDEKDVLFKFPSVLKSTQTRLVLKTPKTQTSVRKIFLPKTVAELLVKQKAAQEEYKELFGGEYLDYNLVFATVNGRPVEGQFIDHQFKNLIKKGNLPDVVFHSLRHSSITYKLKLNGGDMKSVQGDSGHAQMKMVADVYSHIIDEDRRLNAQKFEEEFYSGRKKKQEAAALEYDAEQTGRESAQTAKKRGRPRKAVEETVTPENEADQTAGTPEADQTDTASESDQEQLLKLLQKPELAELLKALAKTL